MILRLLKEPLIQFAILGALVFLGHGLIGRMTGDRDAVIVVEEAEITRLASILATEQGRTPDETDIAGLVASHVRDEALYREALRLGLDEDDTIIRRRLVQKMEFMLEDLSAPAPPADKVLRAWFEENRAAFAEQKRLSFSHVYFSPERRGERLEADALAAFETLDNDTWRASGDAFMLQREYVDVTKTEISRLFGAAFAGQLFSVEGEEWQGPIESAFGLHLVRLDGSRAARSPEFETVKDTVEARWMDEARRAENDRRVRELVAKYDVHLDVDAP